MIMITINTGKFAAQIVIAIFSVLAGHRWLMPIILATQKAEIRRIAV
jgi:hypothetical protein